MAIFIPVQYHTKQYPDCIVPSIQELAAHFDISEITPTMAYSLHTEYSYGPRQLNPSLLTEFPAIKCANVKGVPQLWFNDLWTREFANFIQRLVHSKPPRVIEIHPPFRDYCHDLAEFINRYIRFEDRIMEVFPNTEILIENRSGSLYRGGRFLISKASEINFLSQEVERNNLSLRIALDVPQLLTAHGGPERLSSEELGSLLKELENSRPYIKGIHIWGKRRSLSGRFVSHIGDLESYFDGNEAKREVFLRGLRQLLDDTLERYFVPEVNSNNTDLSSIVEDLVNAGFAFK